jgi:predicted ArsR family transcriptional regulator
MKRMDKIDYSIRKALVNAPQIEGYTIKDLAEITATPWPTTRWHLEMLEARGEVGHHSIGRAKVFHLNKK